MKKVGVVAVFILTLNLITPNLAKNYGSIPFEGADSQVYVVGPDWTGDFLTIDDEGFTLHGGGRIYFASQPNDGWDSNMYWQTPLDNKHFSYKIDVSNVGCHCNSAAYFIKMPGNNPGDGGDYYCDANLGNNIWCPEYDTWEGNKYTMAATLHTCNGGNGYWDSCDRGGCQTNAFYANSNLMCPEDRCTINTNRPFTVSHFQNSGNVNVWFEQEGRTANFNVCNDGGYMSNMAQSYGGMVFSASLWGGGGINMDWLDGMTGCGGECNLGGSSVRFSNFYTF